MKGSLDEQFKRELKQVICKECELDVDPELIDDAAPLFGRKSPWGLDSIDALQVSVALQNTFGLAITDSKEMRRITESLNTLADFIRPV